MLQFWVIAMTGMTVQINYPQFQGCDTDHAGYTPKDDDYINAEEISVNAEPVEPAGKLTTTWGTIKGWPCRIQRKRTLPLSYLSM